MPSRSNAASDFFSSSITAPHFSQAAQQVAMLRVDEADRVGERALRGGDELHVELGEVGPRPPGDGDFRGPRGFPRPGGYPDAHVRSH